MATISRTGISQGGTIQPAHITNIIDALDGTSATTTVIATGSFTGSLIGTLTGTASFATTALSASYAANVPVTASYALSALSSSYAVTASFALNAGGSGTGFPFTGSAQVTGSMGITGSLQVTGGVTASLQGTASRAVTASYSDVSRNAEVARVGTDAAFYLVLVDSANATATAEALKSTTYLTINPGTDTFSGATVSGSLNVSSSLTAQSNAKVSFSAIGTQGNFSIPFNAPSAPNTGSMYWDDAAQRLYIYGNQGWVGANFGP